MMDVQLRDNELRASTSSQRPLPFSLYTNYPNSTTSNNTTVKGSRVQDLISSAESRNQQLRSSDYQKSKVFSLENKGSLIHHSSGSGPKNSFVSSNGGNLPSYMTATTSWQNKYRNVPVGQSLNGKSDRSNQNVTGKPSVTSSRAPSLNSAPSLKNQSSVETVKAAHIDLLPPLTATLSPNCTLSKSVASTIKSTLQGLNNDPNYSSSLLLSAALAVASYNDPAPGHRNQDRSNARPQANNGNGSATTTLPPKNYPRSPPQSAEQCVTAEDSRSQGRQHIASGCGSAPSSGTRIPVALEARRSPASTTLDHGQDHNHPAVQNGALPNLRFETPSSHDASPRGGATATPSGGSTPGVPVVQVCMTPSPRVGSGAKDGSGFGFHVDSSVGDHSWSASSKAEGRKGRYDNADDGIPDDDADAAIETEGDDVECSKDSVESGYARVSAPGLVPVPVPVPTDSTSPAPLVSLGPPAPDPRSCDVTISRADVLPVERHDAEIQNPAVVGSDARAPPPAQAIGPPAVAEIRIFQSELASSGVGYKVPGRPVVLVVASSSSPILPPYTVEMPSPSKRQLSAVASATKKKKKKGINGFFAKVVRALKKPFGPSKDSSKDSVSVSKPVGALANHHDRSLLGSSSSSAIQSSTSSGTVSRPSVSVGKPLAMVQTSSQAAAKTAAGGTELGASKTCSQGGSGSQGALPPPNRLSHLVSSCVGTKFMAVSPPAPAPDGGADWDIARVSQGAFSSAGASLDGHAASPPSPLAPLAPVPVAAPVVARRLEHEFTGVPDLSGSPAVGNDGAQGRPSEKGSVVAAVSCSLFPEIATAKESQLPGQAPAAPTSREDNKGAKARDTAVEADHSAPGSKKPLSPIAYAGAMEEQLSSGDHASNKKPVRASDSFSSQQRGLTAQDLECHPQTTFLLPSFVLPSLAFDQQGRTLRESVASIKNNNSISSNNSSKAAGWRWDSISQSTSMQIRASKTMAVQPVDLPQVLQDEDRHRVRADAFVPQSVGTIGGPTATVESASMLHPIPSSPRLVPEPKTPRPQSHIPVLNQCPIASHTGEPVRGGGSRISVASRDNFAAARSPSPEKGNGLLSPARKPAGMSYAQPTQASCAKRRAKGESTAAAMLDSLHSLRGFISSNSLGGCIVIGGGGTPSSPPSVRISRTGEDLTPQKGGKPSPPQATSADRGNGNGSGPLSKLSVSPGTSTVRSVYRRATSSSLKGVFLAVPACTSTRGAGGSQVRNAQWGGASSRGSNPGYGNPVAGGGGGGASASRTNGRVGPLPPSAANLSPSSARNALNQSPGGGSIGSVSPSLQLPLPPGSGGRSSFSPLPDTCGKSTPVPLTTAMLKRLNDATSGNKNSRKSIEDELFVNFLTSRPENDGVDGLGEPVDLLDSQAIDPECVSPAAPLPSGPIFGASVIVHHTHEGRASDLTYTYGDAVTTSSKHEADMGAAGEETETIKITVITSSVASAGESKPTEEPAEEEVKEPAAVPKRVSSIPKLHTSGPSMGSVHQAILVRDLSFSRPYVPDLVSDKETGTKGGEPGELGPVLELVPFTAGSRPVANQPEPFGVRASLALSRSPSAGSGSITLATALPAQSAERSHPVAIQLSSTRSDSLGSAKHSQSARDDDEEGVTEEERQQIRQRQRKRLLERKEKLLQQMDAPAGLAHILTSASDRAKRKPLNLPDDLTLVPRPSKAPPLRLPSRRFPARIAVSASGMSPPIEPSPFTVPPTSSSSSDGESPPGRNASTPTAAAGMRFSHGGFRGHGGFRSERGSASRLNPQQILAARASMTRAGSGFGSPSGSGSGSESTSCRRRDGGSALVLTISSNMRSKTAPPPQGLVGNMRKSKVSTISSKGDRASDRISNLSLGECSIDADGWPTVHMVRCSLDRRPPRQGAEPQQHMLTRSGSGFGYVEASPQAESELGFSRYTISETGSIAGGRARSTESRRHWLKHQQSGLRSSPGPLPANALGNAYHLRAGGSWLRGRASDVRLLDGLSVVSSSLASDISSD